MFKRFKWTELSHGRNALTAQYEPLQPYLFVEFARSIEASFVLDVGANIGQYSLFSREARCVTSVHAFEAEQAAYDQMVKNVELNNLTGVITPHFNIVSSMAGELSFGVANPMGGNNAVRSTSIHDLGLYKENRLLNAITLDSILNIQRGRVALKVDVEGHEGEVLKGANEILLHNTCILQVEVYNNQTGVPDALTALGYKRLLAVGPDFYFSNFEPFFEADKILNVVEDAAARLIEYNLNVR